MVNNRKEINQIHSTVIWSKWHCFGPLNNSRNILFLVFGIHYIKKLIINYRQTFKLKPNKYSVKKNICSESHCAKACNIQIQMDINNTSTQTLFTFSLDEKMKTFIPSNNFKWITISEWITTKINRKLNRIAWNRRFEKIENVVMKTTNWDAFSLFSIH